MVLPLTILVSSAHTRSVPSPRVLAAAAVVTLGFLFGVAPIGGSSSLSSVNIARPASSPSASALNPSFISLVYGFLSSLFIALHSVLIKSSLPHCGGSTIQLAYWTNLGSAIILLPGVLVHGEIGRVAAMLAVPEWDGRLFVWGCIVTGIFGFLLCVAGLLSIKVTSPITHMFSSVSTIILRCFSLSIPLTRIDIHHDYSTIFLYALRTFITPRYFTLFTSLFDPSYRNPHADDTVSSISPQTLLMTPGRLLK